MKRAFSLLEVVVAIALLGILLPMAFNLIPTGLVAQRRGEELQLATAFAAGWINEAVAKPPATPGKDRDQLVQLGRQQFRATREFFKVSDRLMDVEVVLAPPRGRTIRLATRIYTVR